MSNAAHQNAAHQNAAPVSEQKFERVEIGELNSDLSLMYSMLLTHLQISDQVNKAMNHYKDKFWDTIAEHHDIDLDTNSYEVQISGSPETPVVKLYLSGVKPQGQGR